MIANLAFGSFAIGLISGCGNGGMRTGGLGIFSQKYLPPQVILIDDLPIEVRKLVDGETAKGVVKEITKSARPSDGKYFYTITYAGEAGELAVIQYWHDETLSSRERIECSERVTKNNSYEKTDNYPRTGIHCSRIG